MADIFLSYSEKDREGAARIVAVLKSDGWSVWWDRRIPAGQSWREILDLALASMRCMVVLWSQHSVKSEWVIEEAAEGRRLGKLVPVLIEDVRPPPGFREIQAADLSAWNGAPDFPALLQLLADLEVRLGKPEAGVRESVQSPDRNGRGADSGVDVLLPAPEASRGDQDGRPTPTPSPGPARRALPWALAGFVAIGVLWLVPRGVQETPTPPGASIPGGLTTPDPPQRGDESADSGSVTPAGPTPTHPPVATPAPKSQTSPRPAPTARAALPPRCGEILQRLQIGEPVSEAERTFLQKECKG